MNEGAGLNAVELRRGSMVIHKHIAAPAVHGRCDWRHQSIQSIIGESPSAHDADFRYMLLFSALMIFYGC